MSDGELDRRQFMGIATWAIGAIVAALYSVPAIAYLIGPALRRDEEEDWLFLGTTSRVELDTPTLFKTTVEREAGWIVNQEELTAYVLTEDGRNYVAMSNICTHLGCRVRWIEDQQQFFCPCHNGVFDKDGEVLEGPPPRPLDRFEVNVEGEEILIKRDLS